MDLTTPNMAHLFKGFSTAFNKGLRETASHYATITMRVNSTGSQNDYAWLGDLPGIREWIGDRVIHSLSAHKYEVVNRLFEETISVPRTKIEDDQYGIYGPVFEKMGADTARHPDKLVFALLASGFLTKCYDGQYFFDTDHPVGGLNPVSVSNYQPGAGSAWFLLDCSQAIKPFIWQERLPFQFQTLTEDEQTEVFFKDRYFYGVRGRSNAGFGLWQLAYASKADLTAANYEAARQAMAQFKNDAGEPLASSRPTWWCRRPWKARHCGCSTTERGWRWSRIRRCLSRTNGQGLRSRLSRRS